MYYKYIDKEIVIIYDLPSCNKLHFNRATMKYTKNIYTYHTFAIQI